jgi:hypothetical protein
LLGSESRRPKLPWLLPRSGSVVIALLLLTACTAGNESTSPPSTASAPSSLPTSPLAALRRPLRFPKVPAGATCQVTPGHPVPRSAPFGGIALGNGPVRPIIVSDSGYDPNAPNPVVAFRIKAPGGWRWVKTLWFSSPTYRGAALVRGRRLDGQGSMGLGELQAPQPVLELPAGPSVNEAAGWRNWPSRTWVREPGCYAYQVDTETGSEIIVFRAFLRPAG